MTQLASPFELVLKLRCQTEKNTSPLDIFFQEEHLEEPYWIHLSVENPIATSWLKENADIDPIMAEALLSPKVRPRAITQADSLLLILRVADSIDPLDHEELRSLRIYADRNRLISTSLSALPILQIIRELWQGSIAKSRSLADLFIDLTIHSIRGLEGILEELEDQVDILENQLLDNVDDPEEGAIATLALQALNLRRCLAPHKDVLAQLIDSEPTWLNHSHRKRLKGTHDRAARQLEELEAMRERLRIIREQRNSHVAKQVNQRLYIFSVAAVVFLPLSFLTGLLGVNLGGIPGATNPLGFLGFCGIISLITLIMVLAFRRFRWL